MSTAPQWIDAPVHGFEEGAPPPFRYQHALVRYDDDHAVVFGGHSSVEHVHQDTHVLNVKELTQNEKINQNEPPVLHWEEPIKSACPSVFHSGICAAGDKVLSFGGKNAKNKDLQELYIWKQDTQKWSRAKQTGQAPSPRSGVTCTPVRNVETVADEEEHMTTEQTVTEIIVFGGGHGSTSAAVDEFHCVHPETLAWHHVKSFGDRPSARRDHTATIINDNTFIIFGGHGVAPKRPRTGRKDAYSSDDDDPRFMSYSPLRRYGSGFISEKDLVPLNDAYLVQVVPFISPNYYELRAYCHRIEYKNDLCPEPRYGHTAAQVNGNLVVMGGTCGPDKSLKNDIWILYTQNMEWIRCDTQGIPPAPRLGHGMFAVGSKLLVWGGFFLGRKQNNIHIIDLGELDSGITPDTVKELMQDAIKEEQECRYGSSSSSDSDELLT
eukprot:gb/GECH01014847.1/.p1 GENE.gb/GECH01014847.1/~~gb/GECH01014847.1/.p1  ORF type:complete len:437 (+),score=95.46 gb/GECH01014847.1/:1-1311(+)